ncbi:MULTISPECIES: stringent starvation protein SspA [Idiomarina]|uniref:stringent starvation protein SspA n=1 Tax=Idiomarinaceae TaxID=267893 RepID=UPI00129C5966|nr:MULTISPECIES: stringent starvation protein SspA [Idiomarina]MRJ41992.1 stringent starvation protein A [Idiomarina sp. FeN1]NCU57275.1 stringent starvation protein A [Idiomarina sp. FenA--70]NCU59983.1 stringent starvation protein A [Idiomarina sp. FenBw--71]UUN12896.1 stringent starvation protein A [Idiomarina loihiensis]
MSVAANKRSVMTLFSGQNDLRSHQARIVLAEKGVGVEIIYVDPDNRPEDLIQLNPYADALPTLLDRELVLYNAHIIMEYLDERFPHPPLMPVYPVARGTSRLMMYRIDRDWYALADTILAGGKNADAARQELREGILALAPIFADTPFFMSEEFSLVDCYLAPLLWRLPSYGIELEGTGAKAVKAYMVRVFERDSFQESLTDSERELGR